MDSEMDATSNSAHSDSENSVRRKSRNPEKNFVQTNHRLKFGSDSSSDSDHGESKHDDTDNLRLKNAKENQFWEGRRREREKISERGVHHVWSHSPSHADLEQVFTDHDAAEKAAKKEFDNFDTVKVKKEKGRSASQGSDKASSDLSSDDRRKKNRKSKHKKSKKHHHKDHKRRSSSKKHGKSHKSSNKHKHRKRKASSSSDEESESSVKSVASVAASDSKRHKRHKKVKREKNGAIAKDEGGDEWVELTKELREEEAERTKQEEALVIGPQIPEHLLQQSDSPVYEGKLDSKDKKNMLRGEAAAMAAYAAQGKRIPRRGEIGLSSGEISEFEKVGYVMSGTRHKSMEATRLRKEDQILTAEEKRLLSSFTQEQRRGREDTVLNQFRELIASKKSKN